MYCKKCGKEIPDNSIYCNFCGTRQVSQNNIIKYIKLDSNGIRNVLFSVYINTKKIWAFCLPFLIRIVLLILICWINNHIPLSWYQFSTENVPKESYANLQTFRKNCISVTEVYLNYGGGSKIKSYDYKLIDNPYKYLHKWEYDEEVFNMLYWVDDMDVTTKREDVLENVERKRKQNIETVLGCILGIYIIVYITKKFVIWTLSFRHWLYQGKEKKKEENTYIKGSKAWNRYINILTFKTILFTSLIIGGITWVYYIIDTTESEDLVPYSIAVLLIFFCVSIWKRFHKNKKEKH